MLCSDWKGEIEGLAGSETTDKLRVLPKKWVALLAGDVARADELVSRYERKMRDLKEVVDDFALFEAMKEASNEHKASLIDNYIRQITGMPYAEFVENAQQLPEQLVMQRMNEISEIRLGADLILAGFIESQGEDEEPENRPYLFVVQDSGTHQDIVRVADNFAAIGSGAYVAIPAIHQR